MRIPWIKPLIATLLAMVSVLATASAASADPGSGNAIVADRTDSSLVLVPRQGVAKNAYDPDRLAALMLEHGNPNQISIMSWDATLSNSSSIPVGNGSVTANFNADWTLYANNTYTTVSWGDEHGRWTGTVPAYNADYMDLSGTYTCWGYQSSVSVSVPAGFSWSASGSSASAYWSNRYYNTWAVDHYFQPGPSFYPGDRVTRIMESASSSATFGSQTYSTTTPTSSQWI